MSLPESFEKLALLFRKMPNVGSKSARRMAFYVLQQPPSYADELARLLVALKEKIHPCSICGNITDSDPCSICSDPLRDRRSLCVVETIEDLFSIETAGVFSGLYHVLGGRVSPLDGETIDDKRLSDLRKRVLNGEIEEVIIATNPRIEGDLTYHAIVDYIGPVDIHISRIAYGLPVGGSIEFADRTTLQAAMESRVRLKISAAEEQS
ncbi:MAG: recombination protein RecR [Synergistaceae bacterium]|nr:recombination protein RecR [Synergistaceae bacterium]